MTNIGKIAVLLGVLVSIEFGMSKAFAAPRECYPYRCHCISTHGSSQMGFAGARGNSGIQIRAIDSRVTGITLTNAYTGAVYFSGMPFVGQFIAIDSKVSKKAFAPRVGLMCGVHHWIIDYRGNPRR